MGTTDSPTIVSKRAQLADEARNVDCIISIRGILNGKENIDAVGTDSDDIARITDDLSDLGLEVVNTKIVKDTVIQPFNHFGEHLVEGEKFE